MYAALIVPSSLKSEAFVISDEIHYVDFTTTSIHLCHSQEGCNFITFPWCLDFIHLAFWSSGLQSDNRRRRRTVLIICYGIRHCLQTQFFHSSVYQSLSSKFTNVWKPPTTRTVVSRRLHGGGSIIISVAFEYSSWSNVTTGTKWCLDAIGSFHVKSPRVPHDPSQMFPKKLLKNTSMCSKDTQIFLDANHYYFLSYRHSKMTRKTSFSLLPIKFRFWRAVSH